jgi:hypothetical protein
MYRETLHSAKFIQAEMQRRARPVPARSRPSLAVAAGGILVKLGERLQQRSPIGSPIAGA